MAELWLEYIERKKQEGFTGDQLAAGFERRFGVPMSSIPMNTPLDEVSRVARAAAAAPPVPEAKVDRLPPMSEPVGMPSPLVETDPREDAIATSTRLGPVSEAMLYPVDVASAVAGTAFGVARVAPDILGGIGRQEVSPSTRMFVNIWDETRNLYLKRSAENPVLENARLGAKDWIEGVVTLGSTLAALEPGDPFENGSNLGMALVTGTLALPAIGAGAVGQGESMDVLKGLPFDVASVLLPKLKSPRFKGAPKWLKAAVIDADGVRKIVPDKQAWQIARKNFMDGAGDGFGSKQSRVMRDGIMRSREMAASAVASALNWSERNANTIKAVGNTAEFAAIAAGFDAPALLGAVLGSGYGLTKPRIKRALHLADKDPILFMEGMRELADRMPEPVRRRVDDFTIEQTTRSVQALSRLPTRVRGALIERFAADSPWVTAALRQTIDQGEAAKAGIDVTGDRISGLGDALSVEEKLGGPFATARDAYEYAKADAKARMRSEKAIERARREAFARADAEAVKRATEAVEKLDESMDMGTRHERIAALADELMPGLLEAEMAKVKTQTSDTALSRAQEAATGDTRMTRQARIAELESFVDMAEGAAKTGVVDPAVYAAAKRELSDLKTKLKAKDDLVLDFEQFINDPVAAVEMQSALHEGALKVELDLVDSIRRAEMLSGRVNGKPVTERFKIREAKKPFDDGRERMTMSLAKTENGYATLDGGFEIARVPNPEGGKNNWAVRRIAPGAEGEVIFTTLSEARHELANLFTDRDSALAGVMENPYPIPAADAVAAAAEVARFFEQRQKITRTAEFLRASRKTILDAAEEGTLEKAAETSAVAAKFLESEAGRRFQTMLDEEAAKLLPEEFGDAPYKVQEFISRAAERDGISIAEKYAEYRATTAKRRRTPRQVLDDLYRELRSERTRISRQMRMRSGLNNFEWSKLLYDYEALSEAIRATESMGDLGLEALDVHVRSARRTESAPALLKAISDFESAVGERPELSDFVTVGGGPLEHIMLDAENGDMSVLTLKEQAAPTVRLISKAAPEVMAELRRLYDLAPGERGFHRMASVVLDSMHRDGMSLMLSGEARTSFLGHLAKRLFDQDMDNLSLGEQKIINRLSDKIAEYARDIAYSDQPSNAEITIATKQGGRQTFQLADELVAWASKERPEMKEWRGRAMGKIVHGMAINAQYIMSVRSVRDHYLRAMRGALVESTSVWGEGGRFTGPIDIDPNNVVFVRDADLAAIPEGFDKPIVTDNHILQGVAARIARGEPAPPLLPRATHNFVDGRLVAAPPRPVSELVSSAKIAIREYIEYAEAAVRRDIAVGELPPDVDFATAVQDKQRLLLGALDQIERKYELDLNREFSDKKIQAGQSPEADLQELVTRAKVKSRRMDENGNLELGNQGGAMDAPPEGMLKAAQHVDYARVMRGQIDTLQAMTMADNLVTGIGRLARENQTSQSFRSQLRNHIGALGWMWMARGQNPIQAEAQFVTTAVDLWNWRQGKTIDKAKADMFDALARQKVYGSSQQTIENQNRVLKLLKKNRTDEGVGAQVSVRDRAADAYMGYREALNTGYVMNDEVFKTMVGMQALEELVGDMGQMEVGTRSTYKARGRDKMEVRRLGIDEWEIRQGDRVTKVDRPSHPDALNELAAVASRPAMDAFFDYSDLPGFAQYIRQQTAAGTAAGIISPFFSWTYLAMAGNEGRGLLGTFFAQTGSLEGTTTSASVLKSRRDRAVELAGRRAAIATIMNTQRRAEDEHLDEAYSPRFVGAPGRIVPTAFQPVIVDGKPHKSVIQQQPFYGVDLFEPAFTVVRIGLANAARLFGPDEGELDPDDPRAKWHLRVKSGDVSSFDDLLGLVSAKGEMVAQTVYRFSEKIARGEDPGVVARDMGRQLTSMVVGKSLVDEANIIIGTVDPLNPLSTRARSVSPEHGVAESWLTWSLGELTGMHWRYVDTVEQGERVVSRINRAIEAQVRDLEKQGEKAMKAQDIVVPGSPSETEALREQGRIKEEAAFKTADAMQKGLDRWREVMDEILEEWSKARPAPPPGQ